MGRRRQGSDPVAPVRNLAWMAVFLSMAACAMSGFVLMRVYDDGTIADRLKQNIGKAGETVRGMAGEVKEKIVGADENEAGVEDWQGTAQAELERIMGMISVGQEGAEEALIDLNEELDTVAKYSSARAGRFITRMTTQIDEARQSLAEDSPGAVEKLKSLAKEMGEKIKDALADPTATPDK